ncbi:MAG: hypothetical protein LBK73_06245 [Treponema sp.]|jgi:hypothetical protein|nr:hypothetical protein [Treponema sp.]
MKRALDFLMYLFCIAGILFSLNLFRLDLFKTLTRQSEPIGTITFKYKAAQRRFVDRVLWDRLKRESPVYDGDLIRTAELSEAEITFIQGAVISLVDNCLIQIHKDRVVLNMGAISANAGQSALVIASGDRQITVETGAMVNAGVDGGDFTIRVMEGSASFAGSGESGVMSAGETVTLGENSARLVREAMPLFPLPHARFLTPEQGKRGMPFRWNRINLDQEEMARLEIAEDRSFTRLVFSEEFAGDEAVAELEPGSYFWRVSLADEEGSVSPNTLPFRILFAPAPVLITPVEGYRYQFRLKKPSVRFQWTETPEAVMYRVEVADNPAMTNPVLSKEVRGTSLYSSELGAGAWYWRAQPMFSDGYSGATGEREPVSFSIVQSGALRIPELQNPHDRGTVNVASGQGNIYFSWRPEMEARSYRVLISTEQNMANPVVDEIVRDNFYAYQMGRNNITPGQYYWAVSQIDIEGNNSSFSPARSFIAMESDPIQRLVFPPEGYIVAATMLPDIRFTWKTNLPFQTWVQISDRTDFSSVLIDEAVSGETFQGRMLPEGTWYWRIQAKGADGVAFETQPRAFVAAPPLPAPVLLMPASDRLTVVQENEPVAFSWERSEGAEYYHFKLYYRENPNAPIYENNLVEMTSQRFSMDDYPEASYYWTVQGFSPENSRSARRTGLLSETGFTIRKLYPVTLEYPANGETFEGLQAYLEPGTVRWSSVDPVGASRFILSRNQDFSGTPVAVINDPPRTVPLPRLWEGDYYWIIQAETLDGFDINAKAPRLFRTLPIPLLPEAANRLPADGKIIGGVELKETRRITFSWDAVPGASGYVFTLENADTGQIIVRTGPMAETSFALEDLTTLDVGAFVWRVEAALAGPGERREDPDVIVQRGEIGENSFRIEFVSPGTPVLRTPELLYGRE